VFQAQEERTLRLRADRPIPSASALISDPSIAREKGPLAGASRPFTGPILGQLRTSGASPLHMAKTGVGRGISFASFRRFWAVAANRNSSLAPLGPRRRNPSSLMMRFQVSKKHLDLFSLTTRNGVGLGLCDRPRLVASAFGQHLGLSAQASQSCLRAKPDELGSLREIVNPSRRVSPNSAGSPRPRIEILDAGGSRG
jgi:hypothetical protein